MRPMQNVLSVAVALSLAFAAQAEEAGKRGKGNKKKGERILGTVVAVKKDKEVGTLTIKVHKKKGATAVTPEEKTFKVISTTKFEKISGKKGERQVTAATFAAVEKGEHVRLTVKDGALEDVKILVKKKGQGKADGNKKKTDG